MKDCAEVDPFNFDIFFPFFSGRGLMKNSRFLVRTKYNRGIVYLARFNRDYFEMANFEKKLLT